tara:strand:- start:1265 stop:2038 length:774 start_codon:yes stop_codon:yes gene_type:complete
MDTFPVNSAVSVVLEAKLQPPSDARYRVVNDDRIEVVAWTSIEAVSGEFTIVVPALCNQIPENRQRGVFLVDLVEVGPGGERVGTQYRYVVVGDLAFEIPAQSFQTYERALATGMGMANLSGWDKASDDKRINAMVEAALRINRISFSLTDMTEFPDFPGLDEDVFEGQVSALSRAEFNALPAPFINALRLAQLAEANAILGGEPIEDRRQAGMISQTVGETSSFFRQGAPARTPVCRRAMEYLARFIDSSPKIARA